RAELATKFGDASPAILLQGAASVSEAGPAGSSGGTVRRSGRVSIIGVDHRFWQHGPDPYTQNTARWMYDVVLAPAEIRDAGQPEAAQFSLFAREFWDSTRAEVVLNEALAADLGVRPGDNIVLHLQKV